jgi:hypothetical protein
VNNWGNYFTEPYTIEFNQWYFIAATWKDDTASMYVDGVLIGKGYLQGPAQADEKPLQIGRDRPGGLEFFHGKIDDVLIYNRALSDEEIYAMYSGTYGTGDHLNVNTSISAYPNPSSGNTFFNISTTKYQHLVLRIINLNGITEARLLDEDLPPGNYRINYNTGKLTSGVYSFELLTDTQKLGGKLVVIR